MKLVITIVLMLITFLSQAQFKTTYEENGNPKTEVIDANSMKQGFWNYYDFKNNLVRVEEYKDNQLIKRTSIVNGTELDTKSFAVVEINNTPSSLSEIKTILQELDGEIIIDNQGAILSVYFYSLPSSLKLDQNEVTTVLSNFIYNNYVNTKSSILIF